MILHWYERWGTGREISQWKVKDCSQTVCDRHWLHFLQSNPEVPIRKNKQRLVRIVDIIFHPVFVSTFPPVLTPLIFIWSIQRVVSTWEQWNNLDLVLLLFCHSLLRSHPLFKAIVKCYVVLLVLSDIPSFLSHSHVLFLLLLSSFIMSDVEEEYEWVMFLFDH